MLSNWHKFYIGSFILTFLALSLLRAEFFALHILAYHEAGHTLVAESRPHADRVAKISIIPRGIAALGFTQQQPTEDRYLMTRAELLECLDVLLGGRTAEETARGRAHSGTGDLTRQTHPPEVLGHLAHAARGGGPQRSRQVAGDVSTRGRIVRPRAGVSVLLQTAAEV
jgi:hypothetical protein